MILERLADPVQALHDAVKRSNSLRRTIDDLARHEELDAADRAQILDALSREAAIAAQKIRDAEKKLKALGIDPDNIDTDGDVPKPGEYIGPPAVIVEDAIGNRRKIPLPLIQP